MESSVGKSSRVLFYITRSGDDANHEKILSLRSSASSMGLLDISNRENLFAYKFFWNCNGFSMKFFDNWNHNGSFSRARETVCVILKFY